MSKSTTPALDATAIQRFLAFEAFIASEKAATTEAPEAPEVKAPAAEGLKCLTKKNRLAFIADHAWAKGRSTRDIANLAVNDAANFPLVNGWAIGKNWTNLVSGKPAPEAPAARPEKAKAPKAEAKAEAKVAYTKADGSVVMTTAKQAANWAAKRKTAEAPKVEAPKVEAPKVEAGVDPRMTKLQTLVEAGWSFDEALKALAAI